MCKHQTKSTAAKNGVSHHPKIADGRRVRQVDPFKILFEIIAKLEAARISHTVAKYRYDGISILAHLPGERWEIDVLEDGEVDFERFVSNGHIGDEIELNQAIEKWAEPLETDE